MSANAYVDHPAESALLDSLLEAAVNARAGKREYNRVPRLVETENCWQATINLFWQEGVDREVMDAIQEERDVATSWHTQLQDAPQRLHTSGMEEGRWRARQFMFWRVFNAFTTMRYNKLRDMKTAGLLDQARVFVVRSALQSVPTESSPSPSLQLYATPWRIFFRLVRFALSHLRPVPHPNLLTEFCLFLLP